MEPISFMPFIVSLTVGSKHIQQCFDEQLIKLPNIPVPFPKQHGFHQMLEALRDNLEWTAMVSLSDSPHCLKYQDPKVRKPLMGLNRTFQCFQGTEMEEFILKTSCKAPLNPNATGKFSLASYGSS